MNRLLELKDFSEHMRCAAELRAAEIEAQYLVWAEKKRSEDQKRLKSILKGWGF